MVFNRVTASFATEWKPFTILLSLTTRRFKEGMARFSAISPRANAHQNGTSSLESPRSVSSTSFVGGFTTHSEETETRAAVERKPCKLLKFQRTRCYQAHDVNCSDSFP